MTIPLSRVLHDFGASSGAAPSGAASSVALSADDAAAESPLPTIIPPAPDMLAERVQQAHAEGERVGREAARAEYKRELAELHDRAERHLSEERQKWVTEQGEALAAGLNAAIEAFEHRIAASVAEVLTPFLAAEIRDGMVRELLETVSRLVSGGRGGRLRLSGPADLLEGLQARLGTCPAEIEWTPDAEATDVTLIADDSLIETDIASWIDTLSGASR